MEEEVDYLGIHKKSVEDEMCRQQEIINKFIERIRNEIFPNTTHEPLVKAIKDIAIEEFWDLV